MAKAKTSTKCTKAHRAARAMSGRSFYDIYQMPFFNRKEGKAWDAKPSDDYTADCERGKEYAVAWLNCCDGSYGWASTLGVIVMDMVRDGPPTMTRSNGLIVGFMSVMSRAAALTSRTAGRPLTVEDFQ